MNKKMDSPDTRNDVLSGPAKKIQNAFKVMMESAKNPRAFDAIVPLSSMSKNQQPYDAMIVLNEPPEAFTIGICGRGKLLKDILNEISEEDRGRLTTLCINLIPDNLDYIDGLILIIILSKIGTINLYDDLSVNGPYSTDKYGRITTLKLFNGHDNPKYDLPAIIGRLERLTDLTVCDCRSLPVELSNLLHLQSLSLRDCSDLIRNFPVQMKLRHLKKLYVSYRYLLRTPASFFEWTVGKLPNLEELKFNGIMNGIEFLDCLHTVDAVCFQDSIRCLGMIFCNVDQKSFQDLWFTIRLKFPKINSLNLAYNNIQTVQPIADRIKNDSVILPPKSLRLLGLSGNPVMNKMQDDPKEKAAMFSLLETSNSIERLAGGTKYTYGSDIEYALRINHAGRSIVEKGNGSGIRKTVPLSLWPTILERAYKKSGHVYSSSSYERNVKSILGLHYLIHEVIPSLISQSFLASNNEQVDDDDDAEKNNLSKRKVVVNESSGSNTASKTDNNEYLCPPPPKRLCHHG